MKKQLLVAATVATIGIGAMGAAVAHAATTTSSTTGTSIVDKLAAKFGLQKSDVQAVFDADRTEHQAARAQEIADKLAAGVKAGTITQAQSDAITAKVKEMRTNRDANHAKFETMSDTERKTAMDAQRTATKKWITDNNIPTEFAQLLHGGGRGHGGHGGMRDTTPPTSDNTSSTSTTN